MHNSKSISMPMSPSIKLFAFDGMSFEDSTLYRSVVNSLQYLAFTWIWLDKSFVVNKLCQYMQFSHVPYWQAVNIFCFIYNSFKILIFIFLPTILSFSAYFDVDWVCYPNDRKSIRGFCIYFGSHLIFWDSKK